MKSLFVVLIVLSFAFMANATSVQVYQCSFDETNASDGAKTWAKDDIIPHFQIQTINDELYCVGYISEKCYEVEIHEAFPQKNYLNYKLPFFHMSNILIPKNSSNKDQFANIKILSNFTALLEPYSCNKQ